MQSIREKPKNARAAGVGTIGRGRLAGNAARVVTDLHGVVMIGVDRAATDRHAGNAKNAAVSAAVSGRSISGVGTVGSVSQGRPQRRARK
jgi:hypothetical protein